MTKGKAISAALRRAKATQEHRYIVHEMPEFGPWNEGYHVCDEFDVDGYFMGCTPLAIAWPTGELEF